jgi:hypothetical protein
MMDSFWRSIFAVLVIGVCEKRRDWDAKRMVAKHSSTSTNYNYIGTASEVPTIGTYINLIVLYRMMQALWAKTIVVSHKAR